MRANGTLQYRMAAGGGFDEDGMPMAASSSWSAPVACLIRVVTNTSKGRYEDGKFNQYSYEVLVEDGSVPMDTNRVKLERGGEPLGEYPVQGKPIPTAMGRIKINV